MIKKINLLLISTMLFVGCTEIDNAINDAISGEVTIDTIKAKERVVIINNVNRESCFVIKKGLANIVEDDYNNIETLVTELGVTCETYSKPSDNPTVCIEQSLVDWLEEKSHDTITDLESAEGDKACVIGSNY